MIALAPAQNKRVVVLQDGYNKDLVSAINSRFPLAVSQTKGSNFNGATLTDKALQVWRYLHKNIEYKKDAPGVQVIQLPSRLMGDSRAGDCKSLALAAAALLYNMGFDGVFLRYASYGNDTTPSHVYAGARDESGKIIIVDPVYKSFNREAPYTFKTDYPMKIESLSGFPMQSVRSVATPVRAVSANDCEKVVKVAQQILASGKIRPGGVLHNILVNAIGRCNGVSFSKYPVDQVLQYRKLLNIHAKQIKNIFLANLIREEMRLIDAGTFTGSIVGRRDAATSQIAGICAIEFFANDGINGFSLKKITKKIGKAVQKVGAQTMNVVKQLSPKNILQGIKAVGLAVPRKAFLAVVALNVRGIASKLTRVPQSELRKIWVDRFGGQMSVFNDAIKNGARKKAIGDLSLQVSGNSIAGIGVSPASGADAAGAGGGAASGVNIAQIVSVAAPILNLILSLIQKFLGKDKGDSDTAFPEAAGRGAGEPAGWEDYVNQATDFLQETGIIPSPKMSPDAVAVDSAFPDDDAGSGTSFELSPVTAVVGLGLLYWAFK